MYETKNQIIFLSNLVSVEKLCDFLNHVNYLQVFQRRFDGTESFNRNWNDYAQGFGTTDGEFWLGKFVYRKNLQKFQ